MPLFRLLLAATTVALATVTLNTPADAASSAGCESGGLASTGLTGGATVATNPVGGAVATTIAAESLGRASWSQGRYVEFTVTSATFGVENWTLTGAPNALDITGARRTVRARWCA